VAFGAETGFILLVIVIVVVICCIRRRLAKASKGAEHSHKLLTLRDFDSSNTGGGSFASTSRRQSDVSTDDDDTTQSANDEWERRTNLGETWYYNKRTHAATLERPDGFESDEGNDDIPDAPTEDTTEETGATVVLKYNFSAAADDSQQLSAKKSEKVTLVQRFDDGWWKVRNSSNEEGLVPASYCHKISD